MFTAQEGSAPAKPTGLDATATHDQVVLTWDDPGGTVKLVELRKCAPGHSASRRRTATSR